MRKWIKFVVILLIVVLSVYFAGVLALANRFPLRTTINGKSVSGKLVSEVTLDLAYRTQRDAVILIPRVGNAVSISFATLGIHRQGDTAFAGMRFNSWQWPKNLFKATEYTTDDALYYDRADLKEKLHEYVIKIPMRKGMSYSDSGYIIHQIHDDSIDEDKLFQVVCQTLDNQEYQIDLVKAGCYKHAGVQDVVLTSGVDLDIGLNFDNQILEDVPKEVLTSAVYTMDDRQYLSYAFLQSYVNTLSEKYDTVNRLKSFRKSDGTSLNVKLSDTDSFVGYQIDTTELVNELYQTILNHESKTIDVPFLAKGGTLDQNVIGDTYIEIDIDSQQLYFYKNGECVLQADVVTGKDNDVNCTPTGIFSVLSLNRNYTMYYSDGQALANYFIKITSDGVGIHDASWRDEFGGKIYKEHGSHGCINVSYEDEKALFEQLQELDISRIPVIIY